MSDSDGPRRFRAGEALDDLCRACKIVRGHTVMAVDHEGRVLRVICDYCGSQHNYRGGDAGNTASRRPSESRDHSPIPLVTERERRFPVPDINEGGGSGGDLELLLRRVIREEAGLTPVPIADKWRGGEMVLKPGKADLQEKAWPIETFFHKIVMLRNRLRVLEQQVNAAEIPEELKIRLQSYITACYGTLTSFNVLFAAEEERFHGTSGGE